MSHHHERQICRCGAVIMQCRCMEPKIDKVVCTTCPRCAPLSAGPPNAVSTGQASPFELTRREKIDLLARDNPIVGAGIGMHRFYGLPWVDALEEIVLSLAETNRKLTEMAIESVRNAPLPPIMVTCQRGSDCILKGVKLAEEVATARAQFEASMNNPESARGVKVS